MTIGRKQYQAWEKMRDVTVPTKIAGNNRLISIARAALQTETNEDAKVQLQSEIDSRVKQNTYYTDVFPTEINAALAALETGGFQAD